MLYHDDALADNECSRGLTDDCDSVCAMAFLLLLDTCLMSIASPFFVERSEWESKMPHNENSRWVDDVNSGQCIVKLMCPHLFYLSTKAWRVRG